MIGGIGGGFGPADYTSSTNSIKRSSARIGSGKRINSAADDAANLAIAQRFLAAEITASRGSQNLQDGQSLVRVAEGGLDNTSSILTRLRELSIQSKNGTLNDVDKATIQQEFDQLTDEISRIANSTEFNGKQLLDGSQTGADAVELVDGNGEPLTIEIEGQGAADLGLAGLDVSSDAALNAIDSAIDRVSSARGKLGAADNRLSARINNLATVTENLAAARSRISDTDYAQETADLTRATILQKSQLALQAQGQQLAGGALLQLIG